MSLFNRKPKREKTLEELENEGLPKRTLEGWEKKLFYFVGLAMTLFHIYCLAISPTNPWILYCGHVAFGFTLCFATNCMFRSSSRTKVPWYDWLFMAAIWACVVYIIINLEDLYYRIGVRPATGDVIVGVVMVLLVLEICRRTCGNILPTIAIVFLLYARFGRYIPGMLGHRGFTWSRIFSFMISLDGIFSTPMSASASMVFLFIVFGAFLDKSGSGDFFMQSALGLAGKYRGGPAKVAVISSALFGTVSGNSVANVVSTGSLTIPMMKDTGYKPHFAGAVEATASTGGQIMPPILGSAAFIMSALIGVAYKRIIGAALIPAILYFLTVFVMIDLEAVKNDLKGLPEESVPKLKVIMKKEGYLLLPLVVLIVCLTVFNTSTIRAALWGMLTCFLVSMPNKETRMGFKSVCDAFSKGAFNAVSVVSACGTAGIVIGVLSLTGTGLKFATAIITLAQGQLWLALILTMICCVVLGMGLPTTASYMICAAITAPALTTMGLTPLASHMFIFYFAAISAITPPVAMAAYAAASIAQDSPMKIAFTACKVGITAFIVPYAFCYGPSLLGEGSAVTILITLVSSVLGCLMLCFALQGHYFKTKLNLVQMGLFLAASICLIAAGTMTDLIGLAVGAVNFAWIFLENKNTKMREV